MNPTSKPITITLQGEPHKLFFDLNTFSAFEDASGKFFLDFLASLQTALQSAAMLSAAQGGEDGTSALEVLRRVSLKDISTFLWAAMHRYDANGEPEWPYTLGQVRSMVDINNAAELLPKIMAATANNGPEADTTSTRPTIGETSKTSLPATGGNASGPTDDEVLGSLTRRSGV